MSDYIFLTDKTRCPSCKVRRSFISGNCHNCGTRLFNSIESDFHKFEAETGTVVWWAYHPAKGFVFRDHFMIPNAAPLVKRYEVDKIDRNYGRTTTPAEVAAKSAKTVRIKGRQKTKIPMALK